MEKTNHIKKTFSYPYEPLCYLFFRLFAIGVKPNSDVHVHVYTCGCPMTPKHYVWLTHVYINLGWWARQVSCMRANKLETAHLCIITASVLFDRSKMR